MVYTQLTSQELFYNQLVLQKHHPVLVPKEINIASLRRYLTRAAREDGFNLLEEKLHEDLAHPENNRIVFYLKDYGKDLLTHQEIEELLAADVDQERLRNEIIAQLPPKVVLERKKRGIRKPCQPLKVLVEQKRRPQEDLSIQKLAQRFFNRLLNEENYTVYFSQSPRLKDLTSREQFQHEYGAKLAQIAAEKDYKIIWSTNKVSLRKLSDEEIDQDQIETIEKDERIMEADQTTEVPKELKITPIEDHFSAMFQHLTELQLQIKQLTPRITPDTVQKHLYKVTEKVRLRDWLKALHELQEYCLNRLIEKEGE